jgi:Tfp pilus assembly protein PilF
MRRSQNEQTFARFRYRSRVDRCRRLDRAWAVLLTLFVMLVTQRARAASEDVTAQMLTQQAMSEDYSGGSFGPAKQKLQKALDRCSKGCSGATKAQIYIGLGMIASQVGQADEARNNFATALSADPNAKLPTVGLTPNIKNQWDDAKQLVNNTPAASENPEEAAKDATPEPEKPSGPRKIPGWNNAEAFQEASAGLAADLAGKLDQCIEHDKASLELEEQPRTRLHLSSCERRTGHLIDALRDAQKALETGIQKRDIAVMKASRARVQDLLVRIPHVTFQPPKGATDLQVTFDERPVPTESLTKKFSIDPGHHVAHAEGALNAGLPLAFDAEYDVHEGELLTVQITLTAPSSEYLTPGQLRCMLAAKNQEEVVKCLPQNKKNLVVRAGFDVSSYADTLHVYVMSPAINASISSPTAGWNVGGSFLIDILTAASPDIVSEASRHYKEQRYAGTLTAGYKPGRFGVQVNGNISSEPDYLSGGGGVAVTGEFKDKLVTPRLALSRSHDKIGRGPSNFIHTMDTTEVEAGVTLVLSATSLLVVTGTAQFERGDQSKPYRYVPMFDPVSVAPFIPVGATVDLVNQNRLNIRPTEQLPTERDRYAVGARFAHRFSSATLRLEQRIYYDSWLLKATTTDMRYVMDLSRHLRLWPHLRFNAQTGANFYQLAYSAVVDPKTATFLIPLFRSGDRELSPLLTGTLGGGTRIALGAPEAKNQYGLTISGDVMYTKFLNSLFVTSRTAVYGSIGFDAEFE